ncbi:MAG: branched-chain amino acid transport [Pseudonocardiales bacterium]|nr:branched-chain amino acid transport [Pseudonocardiales bacterium]
MNLWLLTGLVIVGCFGLKLAGYFVPAAVLEHAGMRRFVELLPVALLSALVVVQLLAEGQEWVLDGPRIAGFAAGAIAVWRRAPFAVVIVAAAATAALLRLVG